jgi:hypothetical protein
MRYLASCLLALLLAGCVITSEREGLPTGATLLGSEDGYCDGPVEIEGDPDVVVDEGESTTVAVEDGDVDWQCIAADATSDAGEFDCPDGTDYVRISRDEDESDFTLECFGS